MKVVIQGRDEIKKWYVKYERDDETNQLVYKPRLSWECKFEYKNIKNLPELNEIPPFNYEYGCGYTSININEETSVIVTNGIFRADLGVYYIRTDYILDEREENKEKAERELKLLVAEWNEQEINKNEKLKAYCELHKLEPSETDVEELCELLGEPIVNSDIRNRLVQCKKIDVKLLDMPLSYSYINMDR